MRVVVALGGNALLRRGEAGGSVSPEQLARAADTLAGLAREHELVVTHGNGPQVGLLALQSEAHDPDRPTPLDLLGAESVGLIGYLLERELRSRLPGRQVAALLSQVAVDARDPAFQKPTKPIGPVYSEAEAREMAAIRGWSVARDGVHWRRVVPSPSPREVLETDTLKLLVEHGVLVVCGGGGGIPVTLGSDGTVRGVEAVVDKDATAALLAASLEADVLALLTDVPGVMEGFDGPDPRLVPHLSLEEAREFAAPAGSMGPKLQACVDFVSAGGRRAAIGALKDGVAVAEGRAGTQIARNAPAGPSDPTPAS